MYESMTGGFQVLTHCVGFFLKVKILENKWWERLVPAAAVTPAPRVGAAIIGPKASVAGLVNLL